MADKSIYAVHAVRPEEICATAFVSGSLSAAEKYAAELSTDPGVLAAAITRFVLDAQGVRSPVALYVQGVRQLVPHVSDDRLVNANGHGAGSKYAPR